MNNKVKRCSVLGMAMVMMIWTLGGNKVLAAQSTLEQGTYQVDASLSCYINAMGGVEFGDGLFTGASVEVDASGAAKITVGFTASEVTIYSVTCDTFVDATNSAPGYYDEAGIVQSAQYTQSDNTALNGGDENIHYVDSMTFPVSIDKDTYHLWIYVNSNVMGCQFCDGSGSAGSGKPGESTPYAATLTIDWSSIPQESNTGDNGSNTSVASETIAKTGMNTQSSNVENLDGLSIYHAEENIQAQPQTSAEINSTQEQIVYSYNPMVVYICIALGIVFVLLGGIFLVSGNGKKEHVIVIRLEMGDKKQNDSKEQ